MRWLLAIALMVGTIACSATPAATASAPTPTTAAAAAPKPSPQETAAPSPSAARPTTPAVAPAAAPKPSPASPVGSPAQAVGAATGAAAGSVPTAAGAPSPIAPAGSPGVTFGRATVTLARADGQSRQLQVEVAADENSRSRGLMFRPSMPEDAGMMFLFPEDIDGAFWMQNTLIPLSIAFIGADGRILEIQDMQPQTTDFHRPAQPYRSALEVNQGYFGRSGVKVGDRAELKRS
jgi:uncharacterized protein